MELSSPGGEFMLLVDDGVSHTRIIGDSGLAISDSGSVLGVTIPEVILSVSDMMQIMVTTWGCHLEPTLCVTTVMVNISPELLLCWDH